MTPDEIGRAAQRFGRDAALAGALLPHAVGPGDGAHDVAHILRVWKAADAIRSAEGGDVAILAAAVLLHDCVAVPKDSPKRSTASRLAARRAAGILTALGWAERDIDSVGHAIAAHSFSAGIAPETLEGASCRMPTASMPSA